MCSKIWKKMLLLVICSHIAFFQRQKFCELFFFSSSLEVRYLCMLDANSEAFWYVCLGQGKKII